jgi:cellulose synthase/poly-beta-1,6-N-acetylglucosamine synthase-like glycosyltransferase
MNVMMTEYFSVFIILVSVGYVCLAVFNAMGESRQKLRELPFLLPRISIVVCARNEEKNIRRCIESLLALDYPGEKTEINVVDDESADRTLEIFKEYSARDQRIRVYSTAGMTHEIPGKQRPLNLGISNSTGEIVLITDADCAVEPGWAKAHVAVYTEDVGIAGGITRINVQGGGLYARVQSSDLIFLISIAMGCAGWGFPVTIMGNNISFRRDAYEKVGGFSKMKPRIVEDMALMNSITRETSFRLGWVTDKNGVAVSAPESEFSTFVEQRRRWLNEVWDMPFIGRFMLGYGAFMNLNFFASLILVPFTWYPLLITAIAWYMGYIIVLSKNNGATFRDILYIPFMVQFQIIYCMAIIYRTFFQHKEVKWKGREYH